MRVKLKEKCNIYGLPKGYEFEVDNEDDGFWSNHAFYQGWIKTPSGHKILASYEQNKCEVVSF